MLFQSVMDKDTAETAFRAVRSSITKTDTVAALQEGEPVILATHTASNNGQFVARALTATVAGVNRLVVGAVKGTISHEDIGLVQVYGYGNVRLKEAATVAPGDALQPDLNSTATLLAASGRGAWVVYADTATAANITNYASGAGVIVVAAATAVSGTTGVTNGRAFIRCL